MNRWRLLLILAAAVILAVASPRHGLSAGEVAGPPTAKFAWLRVGEVQPRGWLLDQMRRDIRHGYTPVLDRLTERANLANFDSSHRTKLIAPKVRGGSAWWDGETTGNWLDGYIRLAYLSGDSQAKNQIDEMVKQILTMQDTDGYLGTYPRDQRYEQPIGKRGNNGELWDQTCLFRGLLAYYELTGREDVLGAVRRAADLTLSKYGKDRPYYNKTIPRGGPGHDLMFVDVCEWLQRLTGERRYAEFARFLYNTYNEPADVFDNDILLRNQAQPELLMAGHAAHAMEQLRVPLFVYYASGDAKYRVAVDNMFMKVARHTAIGGACIGNEDILQQSPTPEMGCEHCTMFELINSLQSAIQKTGRAELGDWLERLAYNSAEGIRMREGGATIAMQYCTSDNQFEATRARRPGSTRFKLSPTHEDVAVCCAPNSAKIYTYLTDHLWMRLAAGDGLAAVAYGPNTLRTAVRGVPVTIDTDTNYPFEDEIRLTVRPDRPLRFELRLRVPGWPGEARVDAPGAEIREAPGWRMIDKEWRAGDRVTLTLAPQIVRKAAVDGEIYWQRGPLVFALPIPSQRTAVKQYKVPGFADWDVTPQPGAAWDYAVGERGGEFTVERRKTTASDGPWTDPPLQLAGSLFNRKTQREEPVRLVPMGASLLRRVAFPDVKSPLIPQNEVNQKTLHILQNDANLARRAKVEAAGSARGFKPAALIDGVAEGYPMDNEAEWASQRGGVGTWVKFTWGAPVTIASVWLFDRPNPADWAPAARLDFSDGSSVPANNLPNDGKLPCRVKFPAKTITWMKITVTRVGPQNRNAGFSEIAVFAREPGDE